jgi:hypothetical protein
MTAGKPTLTIPQESGSDYQCHRHQSKKQNVGEQSLLHSVPNQSGHLPGLCPRTYTYPLRFSLFCLLVSAAKLV